MAVQPAKRRTHADAVGSSVWGIAHYTDSGTAAANQDGNRYDYQDANGHDYPNADRDPHAHDYAYTYGNPGRTDRRKQSRRADEDDISAHCGK